MQVRGPTYAKALYLSFMDFAKAKATKDIKSTQNQRTFRPPISGRAAMALLQSLRSGSIGEISVANMILTVEIEEPSFFGWDWGRVHLGDGFPPTRVWHCQSPRACYFQVGDVCFRGRAWTCGRKPFGDCGWMVNDGSVWTGGGKAMYGSPIGQETACERWIDQGWEAESSRRKRDGERKSSSC